MKFIVEIDGRIGGGLGILFFGFGGALSFPLGCFVVFNAADKKVITDNNTIKT